MNTIFLHFYVDNKTNYVERSLDNYISYLKMGGTVIREALDFIMRNAGGKNFVEKLDTILSIIETTKIIDADFIDIYLRDCLIHDKSLQCLIISYYKFKIFRLTRENISIKAILKQKDFEIYELRGNR